tara:strand:- start:165 stop:269 length:105 start_codon:yes stop_codon:yes gene_type:complete
MLRAEGRARGETREGSGMAQVTRRVCALNEKWFA